MKKTLSTGISAIQRSVHLNSHRANLNYLSSGFITSPIPLERDSSISSKRIPIRHSWRWSMNWWDCLPLKTNIAGVVEAIARTFSPLSTALERSEEHTSELQSRQYLVCRLLLEK